MTSEWDLGSSSEVFLWEVLVKSLFFWGDFNRHMGKCTEGFEGVHERNDIGKSSAEGRRLLEFCDEKELCMANIWFYKADKRKIIYRAGGCETKIDFVLVGKKYRKYIRDMKVIPREVQHKLVVVDLDKTRF